MFKYIFVGFLLFRFGDNYHVTQQYIASEMNLVRQGLAAIYLKNYKAPTSFEVKQIVRQVKIQGIFILKIYSNTYANNNNIFADSRDPFVRFLTRRLSRFDPCRISYYITL